jgi:hypothetical protein
MMTRTFSWVSPVIIAISFGDFPDRSPRTIAAMIAFVINLACATAGISNPPALNLSVHKTIPNFFMDSNIARVIVSVVISRGKAIMPNANPRRSTKPEAHREDMETVPPSLLPPTGPTRIRL